MIRRIVATRLKAEHQPDRELLAARARAFLSSLPLVQTVEVGLPADAACERSWDLVFLIGLADQAALDAYQAHEGHRAWVAEVMAPVTEVKKVWNFDVG